MNTKDKASLKEILECYGDKFIGIDRPKGYEVKLGCEWEKDNSISLWLDDEVHYEIEEIQNDDCTEIWVNLQ